MTINPFSTRKLTCDLGKVETMSPIYLARKSDHFGPNSWYRVNVSLFGSSKENQ